MIHTNSPAAAATITNWRTGTQPGILDAIHEATVNIVTYERRLPHLEAELDELTTKTIRVQASGSIDRILADFAAGVDPQRYPFLNADVASLLQRFRQLTDSNRLSLLLARIETDMCRRFHADINDLRLLCTYRGPGTLWLTDDNVDRHALNGRNPETAIARNPEDVRQAPAGAVVILKGATYPLAGTRAVVHRSPGIEAAGQRRLLLRLDSESTMNLWT